MGTSEIKHAVQRSLMNVLTPVTCVEDGGVERHSSPHCNSLGSLGDRADFILVAKSSDERP